MFGGHGSHWISLAWTTCCTDPSRNFISPTGADVFIHPEIIRTISKIDRVR